MLYTKFLSIIIISIIFMNGSAIARTNVYKSTQDQCLYDLAMQIRKNTPRLQNVGPGWSEAKFSINDGGRISDIQVTATNPQIATLTHRIISTLRGSKNCKKASVGQSFQFH